jgi:hypothetical protein
MRYMQGQSIVTVLDDPPVSVDTLVVLRHPYEQIAEPFRTKGMKATLRFVYYWDSSAKRIYRKSPVAPWLEKYLRYDDADYLDLLRYNGILQTPRVYESFGFAQEEFLAHCSFRGTP